MSVSGGVLLLITGIVTLRLALSGAYTSYVRVGFGPVLVVAAVVLMAIAVALLWRAFQTLEDRPEPAYAAAAADAVVHRHGLGGPSGHGHSGVPRVAWLLALPLLVAYFVAPPPLGAFAAEQAGESAQFSDSGNEYPPLEIGPDGVADVQISDVVRRSRYDADTLKGQPVRMVGFVVPQDHQRITLTRFVIACCAADGTPAQIDLALPSDQPAPARDSWIEVVAEYDRAGSDRPRFTLTQLREVAPPNDPYELW